MVAVQVGSDQALDWLTGAVALMTAALAAATVFLGVTTRRSVHEAAKAAKAAEKEADATLKLVDETRRDRDLEVQPVITLGPYSGAARTADGKQVPAMRLRNIGRGPALTVRVLQYLSGEVYWSTEAIQIAASDEHPEQIEEMYSPTIRGPKRLVLRECRGFNAVDPSLVSSDPDNVIVYCRDQLGNGLRFRVRTGDPPEVWRRGERPPAWASALEEPFDWRPAERRQGPVP